MLFIFLLLFFQKWPLVNKNTIVELGSRVRVCMTHLLLTKKRVIQTRAVGNTARRRRRAVRRVQHGRRNS